MRFAAADHGAIIFVSDVRNFPACCLKIVQGNIVTFQYVQDILNTAAFALKEILCHRNLVAVMIHANDVFK
jgi:hypothetical protein